MFRDTTSCHRFLLDGGPRRQKWPNGHTSYPLLVFIFQRSQFFSSNYQPIHGELGKSAETQTNGLQPRFLTNESVTSQKPYVPSVGLIHVAESNILSLAILRLLR